MRRTELQALGLLCALLSATAGCAAARPEGRATSPTDADAPELAREALVRWSSGGSSSGSPGADPAAAEALLTAAAQKDAHPLG